MKHFSAACEVRTCRLATSRLVSKQGKAFSTTSENEFMVGVEKDHTDIHKDGG